MNLFHKSFFMVLFFSGVSFAQAPTQEFRITSVDGQVALIPKGETRASPAKPGVPLAAGDRLVTGEKGEVELASKEGTVLQLKEKTYFRLQTARSGKTSFFVKVGRFLGRFASSKETGVSTRVRTPVVVASVRGTELAVDVAEGGETQGGVQEGVVDFKLPKYDSKAAIGWSDEDPRLMEDDPVEAEVPDASEAVDAAPELEVESAVEPIDEKTLNDAAPVTVESGQGISVKPNAMPEKLPTLPKIIVADMAWFQSVRERVPKLRDQWKDLDVPSQMKLRQQVLRERITWQLPAKLQPAKPAPARPAPAKRNVPKPK